MDVFGLPGAQKVEAHLDEESVPEDVHHLERDEHVHEEEQKVAILLERLVDDRVLVGNNRDDDLEWENVKTQVAPCREQRQIDRQREVLFFFFSPSQLKKKKKIP